MILIVGGRCQGKKTFVKEHFGRIPEEIIDGSVESKEYVIVYPVIDHFHEVIRKILQAEESVEEYVEELLIANPKAIIITDEIGYGIVPMDAFERQCREVTGRVCCELAKRAEEVWRVTCGIGMKIK